MNKHTPGPWRVEEESGDLFIYAHPYEYDISIGMAFKPVRDLLEDRTTGEHEANARLIAAAPELLEVLENLVRNIEYLVEDGTLCHEEVNGHMSIIDARAAISKARGTND